MLAKIPFEKKKSIKESIQKGRLLGKGAFGKVYLVTEKSSGKQYVMKEMELNENQTIEQVTNESNILQILNNKYITKYIDSFPNDEGGFNIVMEFCEGGDLSKIIENANGTPMDEDFIWKLFIQMALGVLYLHMNNLIHRDLKPANIFLTKDKNVKIGDLGLTKQLSNIDELRKTFCGTMLYMSPEIISKLPYNYKADIWALGVILYEIIALKNPFFDLNPIVFFTNVLAGDIPPITQNYSDKLKELPSKIIKVNPDERPDIINLFADEFLLTKAKQLGLIIDILNILGVKLGRSISDNPEIQAMQKFLLEDVGIEKEYFDFSRNNADGGWAKGTEKRGGFVYTPPHGWYGIGLNINKMFPGVDKSWIRHQGSDGEWAIAYHGLRAGGKFSIQEKIKGIIKNGLKAGPNQSHKDDDDLLHPGQKTGTGIYHYHEINRLIQNGHVSPEDHGYLFVFMCRVDPKKVRQPKDAPFLWVLNEGETRPYRLLFRRVHLIRIHK
ncbi:MAG: protein kinase [archaeon]|nr:protein kinase [archaeon]